MQLYNDLNSYLRGLFGCRVQKITIDSGLTCPNRDGTLSSGGCIYCNPRGSGTGAFARGLSVTRQLAEGKERLARRYKAKKFIAYFQSFTNTYAPLAHLQSLYDEALRVKDIVGLSIGTRPDCIDEEILALLEEKAKTHLIWIEYGLQSANDETLARINRGHDTAAFQKAVEMTRNRGIRTCAHVILGLPGENRDMMMRTARFLAEIKIDGVKLHLLYVVRGTEMAALHAKGGYHCLEQQEYVDLVCDFLERIPPEAIIHRLTGDPHPEELVAPRWAIRKTETLNKIRGTLENRNSWQGKRVKD